MQQEFQLHRPYLPNVAYNKTQSVFNALQLIKLKKAELEKQLEGNNQSQPTFPQITFQKEKSEKFEISRVSHAHQQNIRQSKQQDKKQISRVSTPPSHQGKTIINKNQFQSRVYSNVNSIGRVENILPRNKKLSKAENNDIKKNQIKVRITRTKTQFKQIDSKKVTNGSNASSAKRIKQQQQVKKIEEAKNLFCRSIEHVPKNIKMRNQDNLTETIDYLQSFNPFFNRNQRIVNICLLKMGKIILRDSPFILYQSGQDHEQFYIIMLGKVKIVEGKNKRICQTGQTVLQQIIFSQKARKVSLQRAKIIGPTYLLQFKIQEYQKMKEELIRYGLKLGFQEMQTIIKRNYIIKNWMRNKKKLQLHR